MNTNNNLLSVCCLGYNHAKFIKENIQALWNSSYKDIEIIVVDDGSKDESGKILKELQEKSPVPMKVILQKNSGNVPQNFNKAWHLAKGKYITFMALDDVLISDKIAYAIEFLKSNKNLAFVATAVIDAIDSKGQPCPEKVPTMKLNAIKKPTVDDLLELEYSEFHTFYIQGTFFKKEIIDAVHGFDEDITGDDIVIRTKVFNYIKKHPQWSFKVLSEPLCLYRQHDSNVHSNSLRMLKIVTEYLERYWSDKPNPPILATWVVRSLRSIPKKQWIEFFTMNERAKSCWQEKEVLDLLDKPENQDKIILKIPFILTLFRRKNYVKRIRKWGIRFLGMEFYI